MSDKRVIGPQLPNPSKILEDYESLKKELDNERSKYDDFFYRTLLAANKTINHPTLKQWVPFCYHSRSYCLHTDPTGKIGYLCLTSDQKVSKEQDLRLLGNLAFAGFKNFPAPNGTFTAFLSTTLFKVTSTDSNDMPAVLIPTFADVKDGEMLLKYGTSRVTVVSWKSRGKVFVAGLIVRAARANEENSLTDEKHRKAIDEWLDMGNMDNVDIKKDWDAEMPASSQSLTQPQEIVSILSKLVPAKSIMYFTRCPSTLCFNFAWIRSDNYIEILTYDPFAPVKCTVTVCNACRLQIQRAVRSSGSLSPFASGDHPGLICSRSAPLAAPFINFELPPAAPFSLDNVLGYRVEDDKQYFMVLRAEYQFGFHCYNLTSKVWTSRMPLYLCNEMYNAVVTRGIPGVMCQTETKQEGSKVFVEVIEREDSDDEEEEDEDSDEGEEKDDDEDEEEEEDSDDEDEEESEEDEDSEEDSEEDPEEDPKEESVNDSEKPRRRVTYQEVLAQSLKISEKLQELERRCEKYSSKSSQSRQDSYDDKGSDNSHVIREKKEKAFEMPTIDLRALEDKQKKEEKEFKQYFLSEMIRMQQEECLRVLRKRNEDGEKKNGDE